MNWVNFFQVSTLLDPALVLASVDTPVTEKSSHGKYKETNMRKKYFQNDCQYIKMTIDIRQSYQSSRCSSRTKGANAADMTETRDSVSTRQEI